MIHTFVYMSYKNSLFFHLNYFHSRHMPFGDYTVVPMLSALDVTLCLSDTDLLWCSLESTLDVEFA